MCISLTHLCAAQWALIFFLFPPLLIEPTPDAVRVENVADCTLEFACLIVALKFFHADRTLFSTFRNISNFLIHFLIPHNISQVQTSLLRQEAICIQNLIRFVLFLLTAVFSTATHCHDANSQTQDVADNIN